MEPCCVHTYIHIVFLVSHLRLYWRRITLTPYGLPGDRWTHRPFRGSYHKRLARGDIQPICITNSTSCSCATFVSVGHLSRCHVEPPVRPADDLILWAIMDDLRRSADRGTCDACPPPSKACFHSDRPPNMYFWHSPPQAPVTPGRESGRK